MPFNGHEGCTACQTHGVIFPDMPHFFLCSLIDIHSLRWTVLPAEVGTDQGGDAGAGSMVMHGDDMMGLEAFYLSGTTIDMLGLYLADSSQPGSKRNDFVLAMIIGKPIWAREIDRHCMFDQRSTQRGILTVFGNFPYPPLP